MLPFPTTGMVRHAKAQFDAAIDDFADALKVNAARIMYSIDGAQEVIPYEFVKFHYLKICAQSFRKKAQWFNKPVSDIDAEAMAAIHRLTNWFEKEFGAQGRILTASSATHVMTNHQKPYVPGMTSSEQTLDGHQMRKLHHFYQMKRQHQMQQEQQPVAQQGNQAPLPNRSASSGWLPGNGPGHVLASPAGCSTGIGILRSTTRLAAGHDQADAPSGSYGPWPRAPNQPGFRYVRSGRPRDLDPLAIPSRGATNNLGHLEPSPNGPAQTASSLPLSSERPSTGGGHENANQKESGGSATFTKTRLSASDNHSSLTTAETSSLFTTGSPCAPTEGNGNHKQTKMESVTATGDSSSNGDAATSPERRNDALNSGKEPTNTPAAVASAPIHAHLNRIKTEPDHDESVQMDSSDSSGKTVISAVKDDPELLQDQLSLPSEPAPFSSCLVKDEEDSKLQHRKRRLKQDGEDDIANVLKRVKKEEPDA